MSDGYEVAVLYPQDFESIIESTEEVVPFQSRDSLPKNGEVSYGRNGHVVQMQ